MSRLSIKNLHVNIGDKEVIRGLSLQVESGKIHAVMGPNGSGKSTLAYALMGHPSYECKMSNVQCQMTIDNKNIINLKPNERAKMGIFLAFQNPLTIAGVPVASLLRTAYQKLHTDAKKFSVVEFNKGLIQQAKELGLDQSFLRRSLNDGFSGGEKKKVEMLQALTLKPKFVIFDEIDTGLDVDALKTVAHGAKLLADQGSGIIIITHYQRILHHLKPNFVHVLIDGKIIKSGDSSLAKRIEKEGYKSLSS